MGNWSLRCAYFNGIFPDQIKQLLQLPLDFVFKLPAIYQVPSRQWGKLYNLL